MIDSTHVQIVKRMLDENQMTPEQALAALVCIVRDRREALGIEPTARTSALTTFTGLRVVNDVQRARESTACPRCGALPGGSCRTPSGQPITTHSVRLDAYRAALQTKSKPARRKNAA